MLIQLYGNTRLRAASQKMFSATQATRFNGIIRCEFRYFHTATICNVSKLQTQPQRPLKPTIITSPAVLRYVERDYAN